MKRMGIVDMLIVLGMVPIITACIFSLLWGTALWAQNTVARIDSEQNVEIAALKVQTDRNVRDIKDIQDKWFTVWVAILGVVGNFIMSLRIHNRINGGIVIQADTALHKKILSLAAGEPYDDAAKSASTHK